MLRFSVVDFLNARPLIWGLLENPPPGVHVSRDAPSACADKLASGEADVGLIPSIEYQRIPDLRVVPDLGIAAASEVRSVLLVSSVARDRIGSVALDPASRTSAVLTRLLLKRRYHVEPLYRDPGARTDAALVIGDPALKTRLNRKVVLDLAAEWRAFSGHPFVFAFWAMRPGVEASEVWRVVRDSYKAARREFPRLVAKEAAESGLSEAVVDDYLRHSLHYELDAGDLEGLELFYRLAAEDGQIPAARPLEFAPG
ncbi:MAG TPA: menaquinone biosynthesis protein [Thermoanaerobaculia bacterium]|jgi:chorismate dehydratase|nr:menaquinone biosynthesis protein [Thermoanaerobaculia bacterium]